MTEPGLASPPEHGRNEKAEFDALYEANVRAVHRFLHRRCRDAAVAEDLTQDVFVDAIRSSQPIREITTGWLMVAARHRLIDVARRESSYQDKLVLLRGGLEGPVEDRGLVDRIDLERALERLSLDQRLVLSLHYLDGLTVAELARELKRSVKSIEGLIRRARLNLHRELERSDA